VVPNGTLELVLNLHEDRFGIEDPAGRSFELPGAMVSGAYGAPFVVDTRAHRAIVGVHFRPGGARALLGLPPGEIGERHLPLAALWGAAAGELRERLCAAATAAARFAILECVLLARLAPPRRHPAVAAALAVLERATAPIGVLARAAGLSHRRFIELFTAEVGMTPQRFGRVRRFQRTLALARAAARPDWAALAQACGYCDQSHMIRELTAFAGAAPAELHRMRHAEVKEHHLPGRGQTRPRPVPAAPHDVRERVVS
jgi:AraC-like DNA-binding protein